MVPVATDEQSPIARNLNPAEPIFSYLLARSDEPRQCLAIDWLLQKTIERPSLSSGKVLCGADEDKHRRHIRPTAVTDLCRQRQTICVRHLQINQRHVEVCGGEQRTGLRRRTSRTTSVTQPACHVDE